MKAALEAWGSKTNHFHQGFANELDDPEIITATMAKPGVVLRRAAGSSGSSSWHPELPKNPANGKVKELAGKRAPKPQPDWPRVCVNVGRNRRRVRFAASQLSERNTG
jgi:colicin import membrane protein